MPTSQIANEGNQDYVEFQITSNFSLSSLVKVFLENNNFVGSVARKQMHITQKPVDFSCNKQNLNALGRSTITKNY